jgi:hypothetical protein
MPPSLHGRLGRGGQATSFEDPSSPGTIGAGSLVFPSSETAHPAWGRSVPFRSSHSFPVSGERPPRPTASAFGDASHIARLEAKRLPQNSSCFAPPSTLLSDACSHKPKLASVEALPELPHVPPSRVLTVLTAFAIRATRKLVASCSRSWGSPSSRLAPRVPAMGRVSLPMPCPPELSPPLSWCGPSPTCPSSMSFLGSLNPPRLRGVLSQASPLPG